MRGVLLERYTGRPIVDQALRETLRARDLEHVAEFIERGRLMPTIIGAERNPPLFMDVNNAYSGDELGLPHRDFIGEGVVGSGDLVVSAGAGNSVNIAAGSAWVLGDTNTALQPNYRVYNDAVVNLGISPDPTNPRRVLVGAQITDQGFAGSGRLWALSAIHGTPAGSPVVPATPASFLPLANVLVPAAAASSAAYTITDLRSRAVIGAGQAITVPSIRKTTVKVVSNTVAETDLLNSEFTIGPGVMGLTTVLRFVAWGEMTNNTGAARSTPRWKLKLGGSTIFDTNTMAGQMSPSGSPEPWCVTATVMNLGALNSQNFFVKLEAAIINNVANAAVGVGVNNGLTLEMLVNSGVGDLRSYSNGVSAEDMSIAKALQLTMTNGFADPNYSVTLRGAHLEFV